MSIWTDKPLIQEWIKQACEANEVPDLVAKIKWRFNARFRSRMGDANCNTFLMRLSAPLWKHATPNDKENTVKHETCHLITRFKHGKVIPHGPEWKSTMFRAGQVPTRCHKVKTTKKTVDVICTGCMIVIPMGLGRAKKKKQGQIYRCKACGEKVEFVNAQSKTVQV